MNKVEAYMSDITGKVYATIDECKCEEKKYNDLGQFVYGLGQFVDKFRNDSRHFSFFVSNIGDNANTNHVWCDAYYITSKEELHSLACSLVYHEYIKMLDKNNYEYINDALYYTETNAWVYFVTYTNYDGSTTLVAKNFNEYQEALLDVYKSNEREFEIAEENRKNTKTT